MFKYIVTYLIITTTYIPCPRPEPTVDEFGRKSTSWGITGELCFRTDTTKMSKEFTDRKEALGFIDRGKKDYTITNGYYLDFSSNGKLANFKLDSTKIK